MRIQSAAARLVCASIVVVASLSYFAVLFQISSGRFWSSGLGDWMDPYFINALLEHWFHAVSALADPASPPMYFPAHKTLGYSHGLILYAPFYLPLRLFLHPFRAYNLTLLLVLEAGTLSLYLLLRKLGLSFVESFLLSAFFVSSRNVIGGVMGVWSQRASVFLIPPILLVLLLSARMRTGRLRIALACLSGLLVSLMYVQDFYTAHFALMFAGLFVAAAVFVEGGRGARERIAAFWKAQPRQIKVILLTAALAGAWACYAVMFGGAEVHVLGARVRSHDWHRPALIALVALLAFFRLTTIKPRLTIANPWWLAFGLGAAAGAVVFFWIYLPAYDEHPRFPQEDLVSALVAADRSGWRRPLDFIKESLAYDSIRSFVLVFVVGMLAWTPWLRLERRVRLYCLWFFAISFIVLLVPLRFGEFSLWTYSIGRLPGFNVIRDPKRIIYLYELAVVLATALFVTQLPARPMYRIQVMLPVLALLVMVRNREVFDYARPIAQYDQWVAAPIAIDPSCGSFFIKSASAQYMSRSNHMWTLYGIDSIFVALNHSIPTLNGYSAWFPNGWELHNPQEASYPGRVRRWIDQHELKNVCELDIDARTMKIRAPRNR